MKHDPEMCLCPKCVRTLLKAHDKYTAAWLRKQLRRAYSKGVLDAYDAHKFMLGDNGQLAPGREK
jgi:hypothetical protein